MHCKISFEKFILSQVICRQTVRANMAPFSVTQPTADEIAKFPREFALFTQIPGAQTGKIDAEVNIHCTS